MAGEENNNTPWYQGAEGIDSEAVGFWQNKGFDVSDPVKLVPQLTKSYREAERMIGMKADHDFVAVPKDPSKGDMNAVWTRLGKPKELTEYEFTGVTHADGSQLDEGFVNTMREGLFKANVPKGAAADIVKAIVSHQDTTSATTAAETAAKLGTEKADLAKNWGTTPDKLMQSPHMTVAQGAVRALGVPAEAIQALEKTLGYSKVMDMFRNIGSKIGEDKFIVGNNPQGNNGVMTTEQAEARKVELKNDPGFVTKFLAGDAEARREMLALDTILTNARGY